MSLEVYVFVYLSNKRWCEDCESRINSNGENVSVSCFQARSGCDIFFQMYIIFPLYIMIFSISICGVIYEIIPVNVKIVKKIQR